MQRRADLQRFPCPSSLFPVPCKPHQPSPTFASLSPTSRLQTTFIKVTRRRTQFMRTSIHGNPLSPSRRRQELPRLLYCTYLQHTGTTDRKCGAVLYTVRDSGRLSYLPRMNVNVLRHNSQKKKVMHYSPRRSAPRTRAGTLCPAA